MNSVYVLCENDYPIAVYFDEEEAASALKYRRLDEDSKRNNDIHHRYIYYRVEIVPAVGKCKYL